jgi:alkylation response protein AidB-like acyl-CoA dehydrogenase
MTIKDVRLPEENHLKAGKTFRAKARVLRQTRYLVGWEATGCQMGAFEHTLKYAQERLQFGKPIGSFRLIQDLDDDRKRHCLPVCGSTCGATGRPRQAD